MQVYIEYAIIDNFVMDYILNITTHKLIGKKPKKLRIFLTALFSTTFTIILSLFDIKWGYMMVIKLFLLVLITLFSGKYYSFFEFFKFMNIFLLLTFFCGGIIFGFISFLGIDYFCDKPYLGGVLPVGVNVLIATLLFKIINKSAVRLINKLNQTNICFCIITICNTSIKLKGIIDSGNMLFDKKTNLPIIVMNQDVLKKFPYLKQVGKVNVLTAVGFSVMPIYEIDDLLIEVGNTYYKKDAVLGVTNTKISGGDVIVGLSLIKVVK